MSKPKQSSKGLLSIARLAYEEANFWDRDPTPEGLILLYKEKAILSKESGDDWAGWNWVMMHANAAFEALEQREPYIACLEFFKLGQVSESLEHLSLEEIKFVLKLVEGRKNQLAPLRHKTQTNNILKNIAQQIAIRLWESDTDQKIRIGKMAKIVYAKMHRLFDALPESIQSDTVKYFPKKPAGLHNWLREEGIKPDYASLPGPSPKK